MSAFGPDGQILLGYQHHQSVFLVESDDDGNTFSELREMGDGLFLHLDIAPNGSAFSVWEEFQGDLHDDSIKRFGSAFSTDVFATSDGPFFVPDSDLNYNVTYPAGIVNDDWLDIFWIDQSEEISRSSAPCCRTSHSRLLYLWRRHQLQYGRPGCTLRGVRHTRASHGLPV